MFRSNQLQLTHMTSSNSISHEVGQRDHRYRIDFTSIAWLLVFMNGKGVHCSMYGSETQHGYETTPAYNEENLNLHSNILT